MQPLSASSWHSSGLKLFSKRMLPHQLIDTPRRISSCASAEHFRRRGLVDEVKAGLAGFGDDGFDAVDQRRRRCGVVARDVIEADVAEAALLPVAAVRDRQLVPAAVRPQTVHRIEHVQQRQVTAQRQAVPGRRADVVERDVRLARIQVLHRAAVRIADEGAHQRAALALAAPMRQQVQQRTLAGIERHIVEVVEHARLGQLAQLGVDVATAEHGDDLGLLPLDRLRDPERRVDRARKRHRDQHDARLMRGDRIACQPMQDLVDQRVRRGQCAGQRIEARLAHRQRLGIADEFEARVDRVAQHVGEVVQVQRRQMPCAIVQAERAEGPGQRVAAVIVDVDIERGKARSFRQEAAADDAVRDRRIGALQKRDRRRDRRAIRRELLAKRIDTRRDRSGRQCIDAGLDPVQSSDAEQFQHQRQRQVRLHRGDAVAAQEAGQVGGGRVGRVQLRHRRDDRQHAQIGGRGHRVHRRETRKVRECSPR